MAKARTAPEVKRFTDIPNVGASMAKDFVLLGIRDPSALASLDPWTLYKDLCKATHVRQDPCVLDTFLAVADFMKGGAAKPWWSFTQERKRRWPDL